MTPHRLLSGWLSDNHVNLIYAFRGDEGKTNSLFPRGYLTPLQIFMQLSVPEAVKI
jgi:hypothetical protein